MRNDNERSKKIIESVRNLPCFTFNDLTGIEKDRKYLWLVLHRYFKSGKLLRLKRGIYTTSHYVEKARYQSNIEIFVDFLANALYAPSYISLETVLYRNNLLTDVPFSITSITRNKKAILINKLTNFLYFTIKPGLFRGFKLYEENGFSIMRATKAKALFDFLYLRKNILPVKEAVTELRINVENLTRADIKELKEYVVLEGSKKMKEIVKHLLAPS